eukprot:2655181-Prymnesium_polylepis.1
MPHVACSEEGIVQHRRRGRALEDIADGWARASSGLQISEKGGTVTRVAPRGAYSAAIGSALPCAGTHRLRFRICGGGAFIVMG